MQASISGASDPSAAFERPGFSGYVRLMFRHTRTASATRFVLVLTGCLAALVLAAGWVIHQNIEHTKSAAADIAMRVMEAIQVRPKVVMNHRTIIEQQSDVLQLVTVEKTLTDRQRLDDSWLHSTKTLEVEADFTIRAGFDLAKPFVIEVDRSDGSLRVTLPPAEILSVEVGDVRFLRDEDGFLNKLTPADREQALRNLRLQVEARARASELPRQARDIAEKRLTGILASGGHAITFTPARPQ